MSCQRSFFDIIGCHIWNKTAKKSVLNVVLSGFVCMEHKVGFDFKHFSAEVVFAGGFHLKAGVEQENLENRDVSEERLELIAEPLSAVLYQ